MKNLNNVPDELQPLSPWNYFGLMILFSIPVAGFILAIIYSFSKSNINRRNFARSYFCSLLVAVMLIGIGVSVGMTFGYFDHLWKQLVQF